jgi:hypothetical protein
MDRRKMCRTVEVQAVETIAAIPDRGHDWIRSSTHA